MKQFLKTMTAGIAPGLASVAVQVGGQSLIIDHTDIDPWLTLMPILCLGWIVYLVGVYLLMTKWALR